MSVVREPLNIQKQGKISVPCPKCQTSIQIEQFRADHPVRCGKCAYPLIRGADLKLIVDACKKEQRPDRVAQAAKVLIPLADILPEAGTALGFLSSHQALAITDDDRWNKLFSAYAAGDADAAQWLDRICQANPSIFKKTSCKYCGAAKYFRKQHSAQARCVYCNKTD